MDVIIILLPLTITETEIDDLIERLSATCKEWTEVLKKRGLETCGKPFGKIKNLDDVMNFFHDGMSIMFGGFGGVGSPPLLIDGIIAKKLQSLILIGNDTGFPTIGIGKVVSGGYVDKVIVSHIGSNPIAGRLMTEGKLEVEFCPQGTLAERIRAGRVGIPAILTDIGIDNEMVTGNKATYEETKPF